MRPSPALLIVAVVAGCATPSIRRDSRPAPALPLAWFTGTTYGYGVFEVVGQGTVERFTMRLEGRPLPRDGFLLHERFVYADGFTWARTWRFRPLGPGLYEGRAETVRGAARVEVLGDSIRLRFAADQPLRRGTLRLGFDQRLTRLQDDVVINRTSVSRFGLSGGSGTLVFVKPGAAQPAAASIPAMSASDSPK